MKKSILYFSLGCLLAFSKTIQAQQTALFNTYSYDLMQLNIAAIGRTCVEANLNYRAQWISAKETPRLYQLNAAMALGKSNGIGIRVAQQSMGLLQVSHVTFGYAYRAAINKTSKLHLGLGGSWQQNSFNAGRAVVMDYNDVSLANNMQQRSNNFDVEAGALFLSDKLTLGLSALHLYNTNTPLSASVYKVMPQLNAIVAYKFNKGKAVEVEPWLVNRYTVNGISQPEAIMNVKFKQMITVGAGYRMNYGYIFLAGLELGKLKIAYTFDYGSGKKAAGMGSSQQILLGMALCRKKNKTPKPVAETPPVEPVKLKEEPVSVPEDPKQEEPVLVIEPKKEKPIKEEPKIDLEAERLKQQEEILVKINSICEGMAFDVNKTTLSAAKGPELDRIAKWILDNRLYVTIVGYASKDGNPAVNKILSEKRAAHVKAELIRRGVPAAQMTAISGDNTKELYPSDNAQLKGLNRAVRMEKIK